jgi:hypothetical protein
VGAAVSLHYPAPRYSQPCALVNDELSQTTCCQDGISSDCNRSWYLDSALKRTGNLASTAPRPLGIAEIKGEVDAGRPIGVRIEWGDGSGHFVALAGYDDTLPPGSERVQVCDSLYGDAPADLAQFTSAYLGSGRWTDTYWTTP